MTNADLTLSQALQRAIDSHKAGNLPEAERLYRAILQAQPSHAFANHNLASLAVGVGKVAEALPYFEAALRAAPQQEATWLSYVAALATCGRLADGLAQQIPGNRSRCRPSSGPVATSARPSAFQAIAECG